MGRYSKECIEPIILSPSEDITEKETSVRADPAEFDGSESAGEMHSSPPVSATFAATLMWPNKHSAVELVEESKETRVPPFTGPLDGKNDEEASCDVELS